ncbi:hypothetical protein B0H16DRAFT_1707282 [Mycena metata]|uniref:RING-type domain-containing protein n=1 Tax=Mycena metata TaxID=1033252 RepID=A0AAD7GKS4_9AGAR|nr:hypothetical protein B0H16DRAFT_1707282 [Mycena metata]
MANCSICLEGYTNPVSLPCGHVFCLKCIRQMVDSVKSRPTNHFCPTCRAAYSLLTVDPKLVPPYLRPHILPPIRRVFIDDAPPSPSTASGSSSTSAPPASGSASTSTDSQLALALAEISTLRRHCATWRQRAESHAMGNNALLGLARAAKDCALRMRAERDAERSQCVLLKRKLAELTPESEFEAPAKAACKPPPPHAGLPVYLMQMQCKPIERFYDNPADVHASHFGPPMKRRKTSLTRQCESAGGDADADEASGAVGLERLESKASAAAPDPACDSIFVTSRVEPDALPLAAAGVAR